MTIGYPGRTNRYLSSYGIVERMENTNESRINVRGVKQGIWKKWMDSDPKIRLQYASKYANSSNYWKNSIGMNKALKELKVVEQKKKQEQQINEWAQKSKKRQERFGNLAPELEKAYAARKDGNRAIAFLNESFLGQLAKRRRRNGQGNLEKPSASTIQGLERGGRQGNDDGLDRQLRQASKTRISAGLLPDDRKRIQ